MLANTYRSSVIFNYIKQFINSVATSQDSSAEPQLYSRSEHSISRSQISENALKVLYRLKKSGFEAYLVGGCVRDLLLGREPKDFDVVTNAEPEEIRKTFKNSRLIGRRFRLAHVFFGREIIEVATFRAAADQNNIHHKNGRVLQDNFYGSIEEDAWRRDFTVNALYYNIQDFSVIDYTQGMRDHQDGLLRLIGDPETRYREDPVRMLRAIRFAVKLGFTIHPDCEQPIHSMAPLLADVPSARLYEEMLKLFMSGYALQAFEMLRHYNLFTILFPATDKGLSIEDHGFPKLFLAKALENTDIRLGSGKTVVPYFLLAAFLWDPLQSLLKEKIASGIPELRAYQEAGDEIIRLQLKSTAFPKRVGFSMREIWNMQPIFKKRIGLKPYKTLQQPRFRAAYDFLLLRAETGNADPKLADWWTRFQHADEQEQKRMTKPRSPRRRKRPNQTTRQKRATDSES